MRKITVHRIAVFFLCSLLCQVSRADEIEQIPLEEIPIPIEETEVASEPAPVSKTTFNTRIPIYQQTHPTWGFELTGALNALGKSPTIPNLGGAKVRAVTLQFEYQPKFFKPFGVLGLGPLLEFNSVHPFGGVTKAFMGGLWSAGGHIRYQARFFREQPIVPMVGYMGQYLSYKLADGSSGRFMASGPVLGAMFLLNILDPDAAAEFFVTYEISRTYLVAELRNISGTDGRVSFGGSSIFFGLRFEF